MTLADHAITGYKYFVCRILAVTDYRITNLGGKSRYHQETNGGGLRNFEESGITKSSIECPQPFVIGSKLVRYH